MEFVLWEWVELDFAIEWVGPEGGDEGVLELEKLLSGR
jgi:hypothetical protein